VDPNPQNTEERETRALRRAGRGIATGLVIGGVLGAIIGLLVGGLGYGWGTTAMWASLAAGTIAGVGLGWFIGGISSLDDHPRGDEPRPDPRLRGDADELPPKGAQGPAPPLE
jgi:hypothetical protein